MTSVSNLILQPSFVSTTLLVLVVYALWCLQHTISRLYFHKLSEFPGPRLAAATAYYKAFIEGILTISWHNHLVKLHAQYGPIVRVGPNELHFSDPQAYHEIYNNSNRWDKEESLYHSFGEDRSSFGFLTYREAKERKDVLNKSFSARAIGGAQPIVQSKINELCAVFKELSKSNKPANLSHAFRCMTMDTITTYCFGASIEAIRTPDFRAPIIVAMDASLPVFVWFKHSSLYKNMILKCPRPLSRIISPPTKGLVDLQEILEGQITKLTSNPDNLNQLPHTMTIYHSLLDPTNYKSPSQIPSKGSLYEEAQALMFAGADTVGNTLMVMTYHLLQASNKPILDRLRSELDTLPSTTNNKNNTQPPSLSLPHLETLPYLTATLKESLRLTSGVISGLPRLTPSSTPTTIQNISIPPSTIVSQSSYFVHYDGQIFPDPTKFDPTRWLTDPSLDRYLVSFSRGPRSCLGINLAWLELRLTAATVFRLFEMELDESAPATLEFRDCFLPEFLGPPVLVRVKGLRG